MKKLIAFFVMASLFAFASCEKDDAFTTPQDQVSTTQQSQENEPKVDGVLVSDQYFSEEDLESSTSSGKGSTSLIKNATHASQIRSELFTTYTKYKNSYQHIQQQYDPVYGKCSWTSYVLSAACIVKANCSPCSYPVSYTKINQVRSKCIGSGSVANGAKITRLEWYGQNYDCQQLEVNMKVETSSNRFKAIKDMLLHLNSYHSPFVVLSTAYTSSGGVGHYLVVHAIDWKSGGTGSTVYYTDCSSIASNSTYTSNVKTMNLTTFLDRMIDAPSNYNMLFMKPH